MQVALSQLMDVRRYEGCLNSKKKKKKEVIIIDNKLINVKGKVKEGWLLLTVFLLIKSL